MIYGTELIIDLEFDSKIDRRLLRKLIIDICKKIKMNRYGKCNIVLFGNDRFRGYSVMQFITTSSIVGHFTFNEGYLNIFSCKKFNINKVISVINKYFNIISLKKKVLIRRIK
jgi:hypothetical protein